MKRPKAIKIDKQRIECVHGSGRVIVKHRYIVTLSFGGIKKRLAISKKVKKWLEGS